VADQLALAVNGTAARPSGPLAGQRVAVIGAGWSGLSAAVHATLRGAQVSLFDAAPGPGGRARAATTDEWGRSLDNGQHILIGAYVSTLTLMRLVGADPERLLRRMPLDLRMVDGAGLSLNGGRAVPAFVAGVLGAGHWTWPERLRLLAWCAARGATGMRCAPHLTVKELCAGLPASVRRDLIDPLCVAALNTPATQASASVFLRVLRDALFGPRGSSDLLLPRDDLSALLPAPAAAWLARRGAALHWSTRVPTLLPRSGAPGWRVLDDAFDYVVLATPAKEAARLVRPVAPAWADRADAIRHEPIATVYVQADGARLPAPMLGLRESADEPAQYLFDLGRLRDEALDGRHAGLLALVTSGAAPWLDQGVDALTQAACAQLRRQLGWGGPLRVQRTLVDKRATFRCTPGLLRPEARVADRLVAAGDHVEGPYPATLEGAVRSGEAAAARLASP
jgi:squalene-associated FAD-dependent desaturase